MKYLIFLFGIFIVSSLYAQSSGGSISDKMLQTFDNKLVMDEHTKAMINAVTNNKIKDLALNRELVGKIDHYFDYKIKTPRITNQKQTGRCWLFTALNVMRPKVVKAYNLKDFEFSQNYLFFYDQLEKSNLFLEGIIETREKEINDREVEWWFKHALADGGVWNMMVDLVEKYGMVPKEAMSETKNSENTYVMSRLINRKLKEYGIRLRDLSESGKSLDELRDKKTEMLSEVYRMLVISLGVPPKSFNWVYEDKDGNIIKRNNITPKEFYNDIITKTHVSLRDYVMMMNDPTKDYNNIYEIKYYRNRYDGINWTYINLPNDVLKGFAKKSILADEAMYFSCDVDKQLNLTDGVLELNQYDYESIFGVKFGMDKKERILSFESGSTHGMALIGIDTTESGAVKKWLLENSYGPEEGHNGFLTMTDQWFNEFGFRLVVNKKFLSEDVLKILERKPVLLPPWDPMN